MKPLFETPDPVKEPGNQGFWATLKNNLGFFTICRDPDPPPGGGGPGGGGLVDPNEPPPGGDNPFLDQFPDDIKKDSTMQPIKDMGGLAKSYINSQRLLGKNRIALPGENSTDQERSDFHKSCGRPDTAEGYEFNKELVHPSMATERDELVKVVQGIMHGAGLSKAAGEAVFTKYNEHLNTIMQAKVVAEEAKTQEWVNTLKTDFGEAFPQKIVLAKTAMQEFGGEGMVKLMEETGLGNHPEVVKFMAAVGMKLSGGAIVDGDGKPLGFTMSSEEAQAEIKRLEGDAAWLKRFQDRTQVGHAEAKAERQRLFKIAYPD